MRVLSALSVLPFGWSLKRKVPGKRVGRPESKPALLAHDRECPVRKADIERIAPRSERFWSVDAGTPARDERMFCSNKKSARRGERSSQQ
jgi:hypothetical protein